MYKDYFGLREKPFKLVPNPEYLFLSKSHEIALAHLNYAVDQCEGFVVITGEVGTGKTTLCRQFLDQLQDQCESAYVFNPKLESIQLLSIICNEFGIHIHTKAKTIKTILEGLNSYLIAMSKLDRKVVLLIDEAQSLSVDNLEMVRMLSNLETTRNKLLQIILVGQPELSDLLDTYELRQLAQRISLNCHLTPLTAKESKAYIQHRVAIAAQQNIQLFSPGACRLVYRYSGGIPRLINIACDRALLAAYSLNRTMVTKAIMQTAIKELASRGHEVGRGPLLSSVIWGSVVIVGLVVTVFLLNSKWFDKIPDSNPISHSQQRLLESNSPPMKTVQSFKIPKPATVNVMPVEKKMPEPLSSATNESTLSLTDAIAAVDPRHSRTNAVGTLLSLWQQPQFNAEILPVTVDDEAFFNLAARLYGLRSHTILQDMVLVKQLNLPAIVALKHENHDKSVYMVLKGWHDGHIQLVGHDKHTIETDLETLRLHLKGPIHIYWKNKFGYDFIIGHGAQPKAVLAVKTLLRQIGYHKIVLNSQFDTDTRQAVMDFQSRSQLVSDGLVGTLTKIMLIQNARANENPQLDADKGAGA